MKYLSFILEVRRRIVGFLDLEKEAIFSTHGAPDCYHRHLPAFESHDSAPMGELRFPCDIIMVTLVAGDGHTIGYPLGMVFNVYGKGSGNSEVGMRNAENMKVGHSTNPFSPFRIPNSEFKF